MSPRAMMILDRIIALGDLIRIVNKSCKLASQNREETHINLANAKVAQICSKGD